MSWLPACGKLSIEPSAKLLSPGLNEIFWLEVGHLVFKFVSIFKILRINLALCLGYVQIRHVPKFPLGQEKVQIFNSVRHESLKIEECPRMD